MKAATPRIYGLADFKLNRTQLKRLGARPVSLSIHQRGPALSRLFELRPSRRQKRIRDVLRAHLVQLQRAWPDAGITARGSGRHPWTLDAVVPASAVDRLAAEPGVSNVWVHKIRGIRPRRFRRQARLFCVWGSVAIQIENRTRGLVHIEDRLVLVKASSKEGAKKRLIKEWREYAAPYLNSRGELVRWKLVEVPDVYELFDEEIDPNGTEVYSRIRSKLMKPLYVWNPRTGGA